MGQPEEIPSGPASSDRRRASIWTAIHPRLLELVRAHQSTLIFVNSRRIAERLAAALNELAGEVLVRSHHGSLARPQRIEVEDRLKAGQIRGLVATSSLELGIDMGAIDLVVQIEAPPSVASGLQRIGRAGHTIGAASRGDHRAQVPRRSDRLRRGDPRDARVARSSRAATRATRSTSSRSRSSRWCRWTTGTSTPCSPPSAGAAPFAELARSIFEGVLDMLSGRYPSDEFADLRPRLTWDRARATRSPPREGAKRVAVINGGTIPDRGLYGVFLARRARPRRTRRRAGRGDGVREPRRRDVPARRVDLAHRGDHARPRARHAGAGRAGQDAVLESRCRRPAARARQYIGEMVRTLRQLPPAGAIERLVAASRSRSHARRRT